MSTVPRKQGRPKEMKRDRINVYVKPSVKKRIDAEKPAHGSRGKVIESKFEN